MTTISLNDLDPKFRAKVTILLSKCKAQGFELMPFSGLRTPLEQAKLWRRGRNKSQIQAAIKSLRKNNADYLSGLLEKVGPQDDTGGIVTKSLPGLSWHNFGVAIDCYVLVNGKAIWDEKHPGYKCYAENAKILDLNAGYYWKDFKDTVHVQMPALGVLATFKTWQEIDKAVCEKFGKK